MDWWQIVLILSLVSVVSIIAGVIAGIPLSKLILRNRNQTSSGRHRISPKFESQYKDTTDQFDKLLNKYSLSKIKTEGHDNSGEIAKREKGKTDVVAEQVEPTVIDCILLELKENCKLSIESSSEKLLPFQTNTWDGNHNVLDMISADLKWELAQAYLDMYVANNIIWFFKEFDRQSPVLDEQYVKICNQISARLSKIIPTLETTKQTAA